MKENVLESKRLMVVVAVNQDMVNPANPRDPIDPIGPGDPAVQTDPTDPEDPSSTKFLSVGTSSSDTSSNYIGLVNFKEIVEAATGGDVVVSGNVSFDLPDKSPEHIQRIFN